MARPPKDLTKPIPYVPAPPPVTGTPTPEVVRATWDEFRRIAEALGQIKQA